MTVATTESSITYEADGIETVFTFTFKVLSPDHMFVYVDTVDSTGDFTVELNEDQDDNPGGSVTFDSPPSDGAIIYVVREVPVDQLVDYQPYDPFPADTHERALDKLTMICQQNSNVLRNVVRTLPEETRIVRVVVGKEGEILVFDPEDPTRIIGSNIPLDNIEEFVRRAEAAADAAEDSLQEFQCIYHGASYDEPVECVETGDLWYDMNLIDSQSSPLKIYNGTNWEIIMAALTGDVRFYDGSIAEDTIFDVTYDFGFPFIFVYRNGLQQILGREWYRTDELGDPLENQIRLETGLAEDETLLLVTFAAFNVANHPTFGQADAKYFDKVSPFGDTAQGPMKWNGPFDISRPEVVVRRRDIEQLVGGFYTKGEADALFTFKAGDTMTGQISMEADPSEALHLLRLTDLAFIIEQLIPALDNRYVRGDELEGDSMAGPLSLDSAFPPSELNHAIRVQDLQYVLTNDPSLGTGNANKAPLLSASGRLDSRYLEVALAKPLDLFNPVLDEPPLRDGTEADYNYIVNWDDAQDPADEYDYDFSAAQDGSRVLTLKKRNILVYSIQAAIWIQIETDITSNQFLPRDGSLPMLGYLTLLQQDGWANYADDHAVTKKAIELKIEELVPDIVDTAKATFVEVAGDTMLGNLTLTADGTEDNHVMTKGYIDTKLTKGEADGLYIPQNQNYDFGDVSITCRDNTTIQAGIMNLGSVQTEIGSYGFLTGETAVVKVPEGGAKQDIQGPIGVTGLDCSGNVVVSNTSPLVELQQPVVDQSSFFRTRDNTGITGQYYYNGATGFSAMNCRTANRTQTASEIRTNRTGIVQILTGGVDGTNATTKFTLAANGTMTISGAIVGATVSDSVGNLRTAINEVDSKVDAIDVSNYLPITGGTLTGPLSGTTITSSGRITAGNGLTVSTGGAGITGALTATTVADGTGDLRTAINGKANTSHVHAAGDITSGTLAVARGGTGTTTSTGSGSNVLNTSPTFGGTITAATISASGNITAFASDERLKDVRGVIEEPLRKINVLQGYYYQLNEEGQEVTGEDDRMRVGLLAQDVDLVVPEAVFEREDGYKGVEYDKLVALLVEGIKDQQEQIDALKVQVNLLQDEIEVLNK